MFVMKRDGRKEAVAFDKITARISKLCNGLDPKYVEPVMIAQKASISPYLCFGAARRPVHQAMCRWRDS